MSIIPPYHHHTHYHMQHHTALMLERVDSRTKMKNLGMILGQKFGIDSGTWD